MGMLLRRYWLLGRLAGVLLMPVFSGAETAVSASAGLVLIVERYDVKRNADSLGVSALFWFFFRRLTVIPPDMNKVPV